MNLTLPRRRSSAPDTHRRSRRTSDEIIQRVPFTSGLVLCLSLILFAASFTALEDTNWAFARAESGVNYHVGLRRVQINEGVPSLLVNLCAAELRDEHTHLGPWCSFARIGRTIQWLLYTTCTLSLVAGALALVTDSRERLLATRRSSVESMQRHPRYAARLSNPAHVATILCWVGAWLLLVLSLLGFASFSPSSLHLGSLQRAPFELDGTFIWLRHALTIATFLGGMIVSALLGAWTQDLLIHAVVTLMRSSRVVKALYTVLVVHLLLLAVAPMEGLGGHAMLCAVGLYALHEQAERPQLLEWYGALLTCFTLIGAIDVTTSARRLESSSTVVVIGQDAQLGLQLLELAILAFELAPAGDEDALSELRMRDTFNLDQKMGTPHGTPKSGERIDAQSSLPPPPQPLSWVYVLGAFLWDSSYFVTSLVDIVSDVLVVWEWHRLGMRAHFTIGIAIFVSANVWYTLIFVLLLLASAAAPPPPPPTLRQHSGTSTARGVFVQETWTRQLLRWVSVRVGVSRLSALVLFLLFLPFGQVLPFLVFGMLRSAPPELIRDYAVLVLGGPAARLLADDDFFSWFMELLPYVPFLVETLCEAVPMSLVQLSAIVSVEHQADVGLLQLASIGISVSVIVTRAVMLAFSFSPHVTVFKSLCLAADVLLAFYTVAALFGTSRSYDPASPPHGWLVWFWQQMPAVSPLGVVWSWIWVLFLAWLGVAALLCLLAYEWHTRGPHARAERAHAKAEEAEAGQTGEAQEPPAAASAGERWRHGLLVAVEEVFLCLVLLSITVGPLVVLLGTLTFSWLVLAVMLIEPEYGGPSQPWARRAVSDFVASELATKALFRLATVDGLAQCALSGWYPGELDGNTRAEEIAAAARIARSAKGDLRALNSALHVHGARSKWGLFVAALRQGWYEKTLAPLEARFGPCTRAALRLYVALGVALYACAKLYTLAFPFLSFFLEQTVSGTISQLTFVTLLCCLLGMLLLRKSYARYVLVCSVYSKLLLDLPATVAAKLAHTASSRQRSSIGGGGGGGGGGGAGAAAAKEAAPRQGLREGGARAGHRQQPAGGGAVEPGRLRETHESLRAPFILHVEPPRAAVERVDLSAVALGHPMFHSTELGERTLERLRQRALVEVLRASFFERAPEGGKPADGAAHGGQDDDEEGGHADPSLAVPTERQVALALVRELDALYTHMRKRDADVLVKIGVERLCMCLFHLSSAELEHESSLRETRESMSSPHIRKHRGNTVAEDDGWWQTGPTKPPHTATTNHHAPPRRAATQTLFDMTAFGRQGISRSASEDDMPRGAAVTAPEARSPPFDC